MPFACPHWIWPSQNGALLVASDRLGEVTKSLPPDSPNPSLVLVVGCRQRAKHWPKPRRHPGRLCLDLYEEGGSKLLVGTMTLRQRRGSRWSCCDAGLRRYPTTANPRVAMMAQVGYAFADVFCMYAYSDNDLEEIARQVAEWMQVASPALRAENRPYLQIVLSGSRWAGKPASHAPDIFHSRLANSARHRSCQFFAGVDFLAVEENHTFEDLLKSLGERTEAVRSCSRQARLLFSVQHFNSLLRRALTSMRGAPNFGFDFVSAARQDFPVSRDFSLHLQNFLGQLPTVKDVTDFGSAIAASAILKDHYEVGMHCKNLARPLL